MQHVSFLWLGYFAWHVSKINLCCRTYQNSIPFYDWRIFHCADISPTCSMFKPMFKHPINIQHRALKSLLLLGNLNGLLLSAHQSSSHITMFHFLHSTENIFSHLFPVYFWSSPTRTQTPSERCMTASPVNKSVPDSTKVQTAGRKGSGLPLPGTLAMQRTWELHTVKLSRMLPGWIASIMITFVAEWVLVQIQTRLDNSSWFFNSFCCSYVYKVKKKECLNDMYVYFIRLCYYSKGQCYFEFICRLFERPDIKPTSNIN